jgi:hypothetical protein
MKVSGLLTHYQERLKMKNLIKKNMTFGVLAIGLLATGSSVFASGSSEASDAPDASENNHLFVGAANVLTDSGYIDYGSANFPKFECEAILQSGTLSQTRNAPTEVSCRYLSYAKAIPNDGDNFGLVFTSLSLGADAHFGAKNEFQYYTAKCGGPDLADLTCIFARLPSTQTSAGEGFSGGCGSGMHRESYIGECIRDTNASGG